MIALYNTFLYEPIFNLLVWLYNIIPGNDIGLAILALTIIIRLIFYPLSKKSIVSQKALQELQPKIEELKEKYKDKKEEMAKATMQLYKDHKINPASSCLPMLVQLPFLIAVYQVFARGLVNADFGILYPFVANPGTIETVSFGMNLGEPQWILAVLAAIAQYWQARMLQAKRPVVKNKGAKDEAMASIMNKQMMYIMPLFTLYIGMKFPGGLTLYWFVTTLLTALQQLVIFKSQKKQEGAVEVIKE